MRRNTRAPRPPPLLSPADEFERQSGTAMFIIDRLALRVGGEKDEDEADTVGCCSLRVEHIAFPSDTEVELDFLGKDSMRYFQRVDLTRWEKHGAVRRARGWCLGSGAP